LEERDLQDKNREHSPLQKPKGAIIIDNSDYNFEETINIVKNTIFSKIPSLKNKF
jgi:cytidylate kinase